MYSNPGPKPKEGIWPAAKGRTSDRNFIIVQAALGASAAYLTRIIKTYVVLLATICHKSKTEVSSSQKHISCDSEDL